VREPVDIHEARHERERRPEREAVEKPPAAVDTAQIRPANEARMTEDSRRSMTAPASRGPDITPLLGPDETENFRGRWETVQADFIDDPHHAVESADHLVTEAIERLSKVFSDERTQLERHWNRGAEASTEDLRLALQRYRAFFERLLAA